MGSSARVWCRMGLLVGAPAFAPWLAPQDPFIGDLQNAYVVEPRGRFVLGTDTQGRVAVTQGHPWGWWWATTKGGVGAVVTRHLLPNVRPEVGDGLREAFDPKMRNER